jgi:hypothetical protein
VCIHTYTVALILYLRGLPFYIIIAFHYLSVPPYTHSMLCWRLFPDNIPIDHDRVSSSLVLPCPCPCPCALIVIHFFFGHRLDLDIYTYLLDIIIIMMVRVTDESGVVV